MASNDRKLIAVIGATGHQGGAVLRALQAGGQFKVRALTRYPDKHRELAEDGTSCRQQIEHTTGRNAHHAARVLHAALERIAGRQPSRLATWARVNFPANAA